MQVQSLVPYVERVMVRPDRANFFTAINLLSKPDRIFEVVSRRTQTFAGGNNSIDFITLKDTVTNRLIKDVFADDVFSVLA